VVVGAADSSLSQLDIQSSDADAPPHAFWDSAGAGNMAKSASISDSDSPNRLLVDSRPVLNGIIIGEDADGAIKDGMTGEFVDGTAEKSESVLDVEGEDV